MSDEPLTPKEFLAFQILHMATWLMLKSTQAIIMVCKRCKADYDIKEGQELLDLLTQSYEEDKAIIEESKKHFRNCLTDKQILDIILKEDDKYDNIQ